MSSKKLINEHVILLHGITKSPKMMLLLEKQLNQAGYITHNIHYPSTSFTIEILAQQKLAPIVEHVSTTATRLHFVTHSMGGIVLRAYLQDLSVNNVGRIVMLAPPNRGSEVTQFFKSWLLYKWIYGPAGQQLGIKGKQAIYQQFNGVDIETGIIAGNWTFEFWFRWLFKDSNDGKVSIKSTTLDNIHDHLVVPFSHANIVRSQYVARQVVRFLKLGKFLHPHKKAP